MINFTEEINDLCRFVIVECNQENQLWQLSSTVISFSEDLVEVFGYLYLGDVASPFPILNGDIAAAAVNLRCSMYSAKKKMWKKCLVKINKEKMGVKIDFEYNDEERWAVKSHNYEKIIKEIKPNF